MPAKISNRSSAAWKVVSLVLDLVVISLKVSAVTTMVFPLIGAVAVAKRTSQAFDAVNLLLGYITVKNVHRSFLPTGKRPYN